MIAGFVFLLVLAVSTSQTDPEGEQVRSQTGVSQGFLENLVRDQMTLTQSLKTALEAEKTRAAAKEQSLTAQLSALWSRVNRSSRAVAFTARFSNDDKENGLAIGNHSPLRFDDVVYNAGDGYDPQTGIFTAPLAGTYAFFLSFMAKEIGYLGVVKNGAALDYVWGEARSTQGSTEVMTHLEVGDKVWVRHHDTPSVRGGPHSIFTGYLLVAD